MKTKSNNTKELTLSQNALQVDVKQYIENIGKKELERIYILPEDKNAEGSVMISRSEYNTLLKSLDELQHYKEIRKLSIEDMLLSLQKDVATIKEDVYVLKMVR